MIELYIQDDPTIAVTQICNTLGIGPNRLYAVLRANGIELRRDAGISSRSQGGSVIGRYDEQAKENIRLLYYVQHMHMTEIAAKLSLPYDHVRAIVLDLKLKDAEAIAKVDHDQVLNAFKDGASMDDLRRKFHLTAIQLLIILDGGTVKQTLTEWSTKMGIVEQVLERVRAELNLENSQRTLPL
jgi:hypothetical protein